MAKLVFPIGIPKTDLSNIIADDNNNSRKTYDDDEIEERARSIEDLSQLEPIILQKSEELPGKFILVSGFCRFKAHQLLVSEGKPYNQIEYVIKTGDPFMINLAENIQRSNLNSLDIESALKKMSDEGKKPQQIANKLRKSISWVCDRLKAEEIRSSIKEDTSKISSSAISQLRQLSNDEINQAIPEIKSKGGTVKSTKEIIGKIKNKYNGDNKKNNKNKTCKNSFINDPGTDPFSELYDQLRLLRRLDLTNKEILDKSKKYLEGLK